jgi:hypothetical protein
MFSVDAFAPAEAVSVPLSHAGHAVHELSSADVDITRINTRLNLLVESLELQVRGGHGSPRVRFL